MSQDLVLSWLKGHPGHKFASKDLKRFLGLGQSIFVNLRKIEKQIDAGELEGFHCKGVRYRGYSKVMLYWHGEVKK